MFDSFWRGSSAVLTVLLLTTGVVAQGSSAVASPTPTEQPTPASTQPPETPETETPEPESPETPATQTPATQTPATQPPATQPPAVETLTPEPSATVEPAPAPSVAPSAAAVTDVGRFGPTGEHWPALTPKPSDSFAQVVNVPADWKAIATAIRNAPAGNVKILVAPGVLPAGYGGNSSDRGVLADLGSASRSSRILVMPRDGYGTVTGTGTIAQGDSIGYAFVNVNGVSLVGFDFSNQTVTFRNAKNSSFARSTFGLLNVVGSKGSVEKFQLVEVVAANIANFDGDRAAFRTGSGASIKNVDVIGSYFAPVYKRSGSSAHSDTLQFSGSGPITGINIVDSVFFHSSSQIFMAERLSGLRLSNSLLLADKGATRYPISGDRHRILYTNSLWGGSAGSVAENSIIIGSVSSAHQFASVQSTRVSQANSARVASGSFTVDKTPVTAAWLDDVTPKPDAAYLSSIWKR